MLIGVVSDTHNNIKNIKKIIDLFNEAQVELVIHTGDISKAETLKVFSSLNCPLTGVFGNNDRIEEEQLDDSSFRLKVEEEAKTQGLRYVDFLHSINSGKLRLVSVSQDE